MRTINTSNQNLLVNAEEATRQHVFKVHTFRGLNWCEVCAQFLWGFSVQGMKCESKCCCLSVPLFGNNPIFLFLDCSFVAHKRCADNVSKQECLMDRNELKGPLFGVELSAITKSPSHSIPFIVVKCVEEIEARGIYQEGIYRVSGFADEVDELKSTFEKLGRQTNISAESLNIHTVAGVLKLYFRTLPTPLITAECGLLLMDSMGMYECTCIGQEQYNKYKSVLFPFQTRKITASK